MQYIERCVTGNEITNSPVIEIAVQWALVFPIDEQSI